MKRSHLYMAILAFLLANGAFITYLQQHRSHRPSPQMSDISSVSNNVLDDKLSAEVEKLRRESLEESLAKLSDVNLFYWPGPPSLLNGGIVNNGFIPLPADQGQADLEAIMSNRRFRKILEELRERDRETAVKLINSQFPEAIESYMELYSIYQKREIAQGSATDNDDDGAVLDGPTLVIDNVPEGKVVLAGAKLKVLSLVLLCGVLRLKACRAHVERVAHLAVNQRREIYNASQRHPFIKSQQLTLASLYNRQIIITGLLGVGASKEMEERLMRAAGIQWGQQRLVSYKARFTEYDLPVRSGAATVDDSQGNQILRFVKPLDDKTFDSLLQVLAT